MSITTESRVRGMILGAGAGGGNTAWRHMSRLTKILASPNYEGVFPSREPDEHLSEEEKAIHRANIQALDLAGSGKLSEDALMHALIYALPLAVVSIRHHDMPFDRGVLCIDVGDVVHSDPIMSVAMYSVLEMLYMILTGEHENAPIEDILPELWSRIRWVEYDLTRDLNTTNLIGHQISGGLGTVESFLVDKDRLYANTVGKSFTAVSIVAFVIGMFLRNPTNLEEALGESWEAGTTHVVIWPLIGALIGAWVGEEGISDAYKNQLSVDEAAASLAQDLISIAISIKA